MVLIKTFTLETVDGIPGHDIDLRMHLNTIQVWWREPPDPAWYKYIVFRNDGYMGALSDMYDLWLPNWAWEFVRVFNYSTLVYLVNRFGLEIEEQE